MKCHELFFYCKLPAQSGRSAGTVQWKNAQYALSYPHCLGGQQFPIARLEKEPQSAIDNYLQN
jgi:hypothetical protein